MTGGEFLYKLLDRSRGVPYADQSLEVHMELEDAYNQVRQKSMGIVFDPWEFDVEKVRATIWKMQERIDELERMLNYERTSSNKRPAAGELNPATDFPKVNVPLLAGCEVVVAPGGERTFLAIAAPEPPPEKPVVPPGEMIPPRGKMKNWKPSDAPGIAAKKQGGLTEAIGKAIKYLNGRAFEDV